MRILTLNKRVETLKNLFLPDNIPDFFCNISTYQYLSNPLKHHVISCNLPNVSYKCRRQINA